MKNTNAILLSARSGGLTVRAILLGIVGSVVISSGSVYVSLRMGALPWPLVFAALLSLMVLKRFKSCTLAEINVSHTAMTAGSMLAGGAAFTLPAIWKLPGVPSLSVSEALTVIWAGGAMGLVFSRLLRPIFIERNALPYPVGQAAYQTLSAGLSGGKKAHILFGSMGFSAIFALFRDKFGLIPAVAGRGNVWLSPMAVGMGYMLGPLISLFWVGAGLIVYFAALPLSVRFHIFPDLPSADVFRKSLGIGLMIGGGLGSLARTVLTQRKDMLKALLFKKKDFNQTQFKIVLVISLIVLAASAVALNLGVKLPMGAAFLLIVPAFFCCVSAAILTGQAGIDPLEILAFVALLFLVLFFKLPNKTAVFVVAAVACACGLAGDMMNDYKVGKLMGTPPGAMFISEAIGAVVGGAAACFTIFALIKSHGPLGGSFLPAPQASGVAAIISGAFFVHKAFIIGLIVGVILCAAPIPVLAVALGVYLPISISIPVGLGGLAALVGKIVHKKMRITNDNGMVVAGGLLAGESFIGALLALVAQISGK